jgi:hypothetical protein
MTSVHTDPDIGEYTAYGISVEFRGKTVTVKNISTIKDKVLKMAGTFNKHGLSPLHLTDVVEDML